MSSVFFYLGEIYFSSEYHSVLETAKAEIWNIASSLPNQHVYLRWLIWSEYLSNSPSSSMRHIGRIRVYWSPPGSLNSFTDSSVAEAGNYCTALLSSCPYTKHRDPTETQLSGCWLITSDGRKSQSSAPTLCLHSACTGWFWQEPTWQQLILPPALLWQTFVSLLSTTVVPPSQPAVPTASQLAGRTALGSLTALKSTVM